MEYFEEVCNWIEYDVKTSKGGDFYITIESKDPKSITVFDAMNGEEDSRFYTIHNPDYMTKDYFKSIIRVSDEVKKLPVQLDVDGLCKYLDKDVDKPVFSTVQRIVFCTGDEEDEDTLFKDELLSESVFEAGHHLPSDGLIGLRWWENDVILINVKEIMETTNKMEEEFLKDGMYFNKYDNVVNDGIITTMLHEARHCAQENPYLSEERFNLYSYNSENDAETYARNWYENHPVFVLQKQKEIVVDKPISKRNREI